MAEGGRGCARSWGSDDVEEVSCDHRPDTTLGVRSSRRSRSARVAHHPGRSVSRRSRSRRVVDHPGRSVLPAVAKSEGGRPPGRSVLPAVAKSEGVVDHPRRSDLSGRLRRQNRSPRLSGQAERALLSSKATGERADVAFPAFPSAAVPSSDGRIVTMAGAARAGATFRTSPIDSGDKTGLSASPSGEEGASVAFPAFRAPGGCRRLTAGSS